MKKTLLLFAALIIIAAVTPAQKRAFTLDDIYRVQYTGAPHLSPSQQKIAYTLSSYDLKEGDSNRALFLMNPDGSETTELKTGEETVYGHFWGADDETLYYTTLAEGAVQVFQYVFDADSGRQVTDIYPGVTDPVLSPDGKLIAFTAEVYAECGADEECNREMYKRAKEGPVQAYLADETLYRHWTEWNEERWNHIFIYNIETGEVKDLTPGPHESPIFMLGGGIGYAFTSDSESIIYVSNREEDQAATTNADMWMVSVEGGEPVNITDENNAWDGHPVVSPSGNYIAYHTQRIPGYESDKVRVAVYDIASGTTKMITDHFDNWTGQVEWSADETKIYFLADEEGYSPLFVIDLVTEEITKIIDKASIGSFAVDEDENFIYYTNRLNHRPTEIYRYALGSGEETQLTFVNQELVDEVDFRPVEHMWVDGEGDYKIHVMLITPHGFDPSKKYPLVVNIHGGPQGQWMDAYRGDGQVYGGYGYIVAMPNPTGSTGYGQEFTRAISGDWGGRVYRDIMAVTDSLEKLPYVDEDRIGAMGWSFGGYMVNWILGQTDRYQCLASMMGLYNLTSFYGATEELWFPQWDLDGVPWQSEDYKQFSPSEYAANFKTPTLIVSGELDYRVSYTESLQLFTALKQQDIDSRMIIFENDGHWPGHTTAMPLYYNAHLEWFHKYLGGKEAPYNSRDIILNKAFGWEPEEEE